MEDAENCQKVKMPCKIIYFVLFFCGCMVLIVKQLTKSEYISVHLLYFISKTLRQDHSL